MNPILGTMNIEYKYSSLDEYSSLDNNLSSDKYSSLDNNHTNKYKDIIHHYLKEYDNRAILDTAYYYGDTKTEVVLGKILKDLGHTPKIATKANPWYNNDFTNGILGQLSPNNLENQLNTSLHNLMVDNVEVFYLHCPDYETPFKDTLEKCDELWRKEKFNFLGISNHSDKQLLEIIDICDKENYVIPRYYQGMYNLISRKVESIFPILDEYNIEFWAYNPLAGGLLTGKYKDFIKNEDITFNSRFKNNKIYQNIFWKEDIIKNLSTFFNYDNQTDIAFQWLKNNSKMRENDKIILGVSTPEQLDKNIHIMRNNSCIGEDIIHEINNIYSKIEPISPNYFY
jgi:aflatoxin B1 aldehyde reductase